MATLSSAVHLFRY